MKIISAFILFISFGFIFSCSSDDEEVTPTANDTIATDAAIVQAEVNEVIIYSNDAIENGTGKAKIDFSFCASLTHNPDTKTITLDFGDVGCGTLVTRTGVISINYVGDPQSQGDRTISFDNYSVNGNTISGSITVSNIRTNSNDNPELTVIVDNLVYNNANSQNITLSLSQTFEWTEGAGNQNTLDDVISISGFSSGSSSEGINYSSTITTPLIYHSNCLVTNNPYPVSGAQDIVPSGETSFSIDYGNGSCDKKATISIGLFSYEIDLP